MVEGAPLVPVLVYGQRLSRMLEGRDQTVALDEDVLLQYLALEYADKAGWLAALKMALEMRSLVVVLDGIDEAAGWRDSISLLVRRVLVPAGLRVLCTSRPEGVVIVADFESRFVIIDLKPLSEDQQREADDVMKEMVNNDEDEEYNDEYFDQLGKETV